MSPTKAEQMAEVLTESSMALNRCKCGSKVIMRYDPGCTFIICLAEAKTKLAIPEWGPVEIKEKWNNQR